MTDLVQRLRALIAPLTRTPAFRRVAPQVLPHVERALAWVTRGRLQLSAVLVPSLVLHTVGARSGELRDTFLMYTPDGAGGVIVAGTAFAQDRHPAWTYNLLAHPYASVSIAGRRTRVRATLLGDDERDAAWDRIQAQWPGYRAYERDSGRVVRLFRLQRVAAPTRAPIPKE